MTRTDFKTIVAFLFLTTEVADTAPLACLINDFCFKLVSVPRILAKYERYMPKA